MPEVGPCEARNRISELLDSASAGEEVMIMRHGKPMARLVALDRAEPAFHFPDHSGFRAQQPVAQQSSADLIREMRDERG